MALTKAAELAVLDQAIARLGEHSYLGPWLAAVRGEVERDIRSDWALSVLPSDVCQRAAETIANAQAEANRLIGEARDTAARITAAADGVARERIATADRVAADVTGEARRCYARAMVEACNAVLDGGR